MSASAKVAVLAEALFRVWLASRFPQPDPQPFWRDIPTEIKDAWYKVAEAALALNE